MDQLVEILQVELFGRGPQVALVIGKRHQIAVDRGDQGEAPNVELPVFEQSRVFYVFLYDESPCIPSFRITRIDIWLYFVQFGLNSDSNTSISIFSWFKDPYILLIFSILAMFQLFFCLIQLILQLRFLKRVSFLLHHIVLFLYVHFP